uniref:BTB domain-containing protein n=1 Tax=Angiostrongylus cantonensis TaxID=6313 RepID=A0A158P9J2_ANGCA
MSTGSSIIATEECETAEEIDNPSFGFIQFQLSVDDVGLQGVRIRPGSSEFEYEHFLFTVNQVRQENQCTIKFSCSTVAEYEWRIIAQMRIKVGISGSTILKVVDKDVFEFYPKARPISFEVTNDAVATVKFELRILNKLIEPLPTFEEGDLTIHFAEDTPIRVYRELLALFSPYMKQCTESTQRTSVGDFPKDAFIEMLYHIYPTLRPLYRNLRNLAKAAVAFQAIPLIYELSKNLFIGVRLLLISTIVFIYFDRAAQDGVWGHLIKLGFEPETFFGAEIYRRLVCPAILASSLNKSNITLIFRRTPFYVNRGLIQVHGTSKFTVTSDGHLHALFTREMEEQCAKGALIPGEVLVALLCSLYPLGPQVPTHFLRAAIVFCHDHDWNHVKNQLEQNLLQEPPESCDVYRDQIIFAEKFDLRNMLSICIQRAEASCNAFANELVRREDFNLISSKTRDLIMDRLCSGWGLEPKHVNKLGTREPTSFRERQIGLTGGGPQCLDDERNTATLANMDSDYYFGSVGELCVVKN